MKKFFATLGLLGIIGGPSSADGMILKQADALIKTNPGKLTYTERRKASIGLAVKMGLRALYPTTEPRAASVVAAVEFLSNFKILGEVSPFYRLGPSGFYLELNPAMQTNPEIFHALSVSYDKKPAAIHVDQNYEVPNGMTGMNRDIIIRLSVMAKRHTEIRQIFGMNFVHFLWTNHSLFVNRDHIPFPYLTYKYHNVILTCLEKRGDINVDETTIHMLHQLTLHEMCLYLLGNDDDDIYLGGLEAVLTRGAPPNLPAYEILTAHKFFGSCTPEESLKLFKPLEREVTLLEWQQKWDFASNFLRKANHTSHKPVCLRIIACFNVTNEFLPDSAVTYLLDDISNSEGVNEICMDLLKSAVEIDHRYYITYQSYCYPFLSCLDAGYGCSTDLSEGDPAKREKKRQILKAAGAKDKKLLDEEKRAMEKNTEK